MAIDFEKTANSTGGLRVKEPREKFGTKFARYWLAYLANFGGSERRARGWIANARLGKL